MSLRFIWHNLGARVGFYSIENAAEIPDAPGVYAWFLPLYVINDNLDTLLNLFQRVYLYDATCGGLAMGEVNHNFHWESLKIHLEKQPHRKLGEGLKHAWGKVVGNKKLSDAFKSVLMEASLLMPPLYVGKADNLKARYEQHLKGGGRKEDDFHKRFTRYAATNNIPIGIGDLLFLCIQTETDVARTLYGRKDMAINSLLEQVIIKLARPPFSIR